MSIPRSKFWKIGSKGCFSMGRGQVPGGPQKPASPGTWVCDGWDSPGFNKRHQESRTLYEISCLGHFPLMLMSHLHILSSGSSDDHRTLNKVGEVEMSTSWTCPWLRKQSGASLPTILGHWNRRVELCQVCFHANTPPQPLISLGFQGLQWTQKWYGTDP